MRPVALYLFTAFIFLVFTACSNNECNDPTATNYNPEAVGNKGCEYDNVLEDLKASFKLTYADIVHASYADAHSKAVELQAAIDAFVNDPTEANLDAAKRAWLAAREPYGQTEAFRFSGGPIDDDDGPEGLINAWPMDESYVDYTTGNATSGIINDPEGFPDLTAQVLGDQNEKGGEENVSTGFHAIEFLLWGQDDSDVSLKTPGSRPATDFQDGGTAENQARRREYLTICAALLVQHLQGMANEWAPAANNNYRATFLEADNNQSLSSILTGIGTLSKSEFAGERLFVPLDNQDQEDEHSCFSDNTHRDIVANAQGIRNIFSGTYIGIDGNQVSGTGLNDLVNHVNVPLGAEMETLSASTVTLCEAIPAPFDLALTQETVGGKGPIMMAIVALQNQGDKITEAASALGLAISADR